MPFAYEFLFKEQGVYEIGLKASAQDVLGDSLTIELCVKTSQAREINSGRPCTLYEVAWVRERTMLNGEGNANPS